MELTLGEYRGPMFEELYPDSSIQCFEVSSMINMWNSTLLNSIYFST